MGFEWYVKGFVPKVQGLDVLCNPTPAGVFFLACVVFVEVNGTRSSSSVSFPRWLIVS